MYKNEILITFVFISFSYVTKSASSFASFFNCMTGVDPQTKSRLPPQSVSDGRCLTINVCGRAHRGPASDIFVFLLQIAIEPFALFITVFLITCICVPL